MILPGSGMRIVVATRPVNFRKQYDGLAAIVANDLGLDGRVPSRGVRAWRPSR